MQMQRTKIKDLHELFRVSDGWDHFACVHCGAKNPQMHLPCPSKAAHALYEREA